MKRSNGTPRGVRASRSSCEKVCSAAALFALENLELRKLFSAYELTNTITSPDPQPSDLYGSFVAAQGNLAVVGAPNRQVGAQPLAGEAYLINTTTGATLHTFSNVDPDAGDQFGAYACFVGSKLAISAPGPETAVYVYDLNDLNAEPMVIVAPQSGQQFGRAMASDGTDLFVSMPISDAPGNAGRIFRFNASTGALIDEYMNSDTSDDDSLGANLAISNGTIYASAVEYVPELSSFAQGRVLAIDIDSGNVVQTFSDPDPQFDDPFRGFGGGLEVAANGDVFIGCGDITTGGLVFQFDSDGNLIRDYVSPRINTRGNEGFGFWIDSNDQGELIVGAQYTLAFDNDEAPTVAMPNGSVYVFDYASGTHTGTIDNPTPVLDENIFDNPDGFGLVFAALGDGKILIADPNDNDLTPGADTDTGSVFVYAPEGAANTAPTADPIDGPTSGVRQQTLAFTGSFSDPDAGDTHVVSWDFGDGNVIAFHSTDDAGALAPTHVYANSGSYTITMTVKDAAGDFSSVQQGVSIAATGIVGGTFYVGGSNGADSVSINKNGSGGIDITIGAVTQTYNGSSIVILGGSGNDEINVGGSVTASIFINGGAGNDSIKGGAGSDILIGGDGNDMVVGGAGRDLLIGGTGADRIIGNTDDDILVAGITIHDDDPDALASILAEWTSSRTYAQRVNNIRDGSGSVTRLNGDNFLTAIDDQAADVLTGSQGSDWFIFNNDSLVEDKVTDLKSGEFSDEDLAFIMS